MFLQVSWIRISIRRLWRFKGKPEGKPPVGTRSGGKLVSVFFSGELSRWPVAKVQGSAGLGLDQFARAALTGANEPRTQPSKRRVAEVEGGNEIPASSFKAFDSAGLDKFPKVRGAPR